MARIFDDIRQAVLVASPAALAVSIRADYGVDSFNGEELSAALKSLRDEGRLPYAEGDAMLREPRTVSSMGSVEAAAT